MRIVTGSDHAGFSLKQELISWLEEHGHDVIDKGTAVGKFCAECKTCDTKGGKEYIAKRCGAGRDTVCKAVSDACAAGTHPDHRGHLAYVLERGKLEFLEDRLAPAYGHDDCSRSEPYRFELLPDPLSDFLRVLQVEILAWHREQFNAAHLCRAP